MDFSLWGGRPLLADELAFVPGLAVLRGDIGLIHDWFLFRGRELKSALSAEGQQLKAAKDI
jgi:hypothetical protein